jgi:PPOX class probable F420-dependent enzyme
MTVQIPDSHKDLLAKPVFAVLTTIMPDGQPQSTVVWIDYDGEYVRFNTVRGRQKDRNLQKDSRVSLTLIDPDNGYRWLELRGSVEVDEASGREHIEKLSWKYEGQKYYGGFNTWTKPEDETRVVYRVHLTRVNADG